MYNVCCCIKDCNCVGLSMCCCSSCCIWWRPLAELSIICEGVCDGGAPGGPPGGGPWEGFDGELLCGACGLWCGLGWGPSAPELGCCDCCVIIGCFCWVMGAAVTACPAGLSFPLLWYSILRSCCCCWSTAPLPPVSAMLPLPESRLRVVDRRSLSRQSRSRDEKTLSRDCCCCCFRAANSEVAWNTKMEIESSIKGCCELPCGEITLYRKTSARSYILNIRDSNRYLRSDKFRDKERGLNEKDSTTQNSGGAKSSSGRNIHDINAT